MKQRSSCKAQGQRLKAGRLLAVSIALFFASPLFGVSLPSPSSAVIVIRGTLGSLPGNHPTLVSNDQTYKLFGQSAYLLHTLQDKRLLHQELELVGTKEPDGRFEVQRIFAVHGGKLYKIQYYCPVCNITYVQPGHCECCGRETKLQEVPVN